MRRRICQPHLKPLCIIGKRKSMPFNSLCITLRLYDFLVQLVAVSH